MKQKIAAFLILVSLCAVSAAPMFIHAATSPYTGLVQCDGVVDGKYVDQVVDGKTVKVFVQDPASVAKNEKKCNFIELINGVKSIINWMFYIAIPIAIALFAYAGVLYMSGTSGNVSQAKSVFTSVGIGFALMCSAWFVVYTILTWITKSDQGFTTLLK